MLTQPLNYLRRNLVGTHDIGASENTVTAEETRFGGQLSLAQLHEFADMGQPLPQRAR